MSWAFWLKIAGVLLGTVALALLVWFGGPFLALGETRPFEPLFVRLPIVLLLAFAGLGWARQPTLPPALLFGWLTLAAPFLVMQPGMGAGLAASKTPDPMAARLKSVIGHTVFGLGLYGAAMVVAWGMG